MIHRLAEIDRGRQVAHHPAILDVGERREEYERQSVQIWPFTTQRGQHRVTGHDRHPAIADYEIRRLGENQGQAVLSIGCPANLIARILENFGDIDTKGWLVFHDDDLRHRLLPLHDSNGVAKARPARSESAPVPTPRARGNAVAAAIERTRQRIEAAPDS